MKSPTPQRPWPQVRPVPLVLAIAMAAVTAYVLFEDVLHGASLTTTHITSAATLIATIAAGHMFWPQFKTGKLVSALGLLAVFLAGTAYVVTMSGARNAETAAAKKANAAEYARQRGDLMRMKTEAETILAACTDATPKKFHGIRCGLRDAMTAECGSGKGKMCDGKSYSVRTYEAALAGYDAKLAALGPAKVASGYRHAAEVLAALPFTTESADAIEARLTLVLPYLLVMVVEVATLTFSNMAIGHRLPAKAPTSQPTFASNPTAPQPPKGGRKIKRISPAKVPANVVSFAGKREAIAALEKAGRPISNRELANLMGVTDGEASKRVRELGDLVEVRRNGKALSIGLRQRRAAA